MKTVVTILAGVGLTFAGAIIEAQSGMASLVLATDRGRLPQFIRRPPGQSRHPADDLHMAGHIDLLPLLDQAALHAELKHQGSIYAAVTEPPQQLTTSDPAGGRRRRSPRMASLGSCE